jgi:hypothetical protein
MKTFRIKTRDDSGPLAVELQAEDEKAARLRAAAFVIAPAAGSIRNIEILAVEEVSPLDQGGTEA